MTQFLKNPHSGSKIVGSCIPETGNKTRLSGFATVITIEYQQE